MPPRGVKKESKRGRQYEHIKESGRERGMSTDRAEQMAARTVNKERSEAGESSRGSRIRPARTSGCPAAPRGTEAARAVR